VSSVQATPSEVPGVARSLADGTQALADRLVAVDRGWRRWRSKAPWLHLIGHSTLNG